MWLSNFGAGDGGECNWRRKEQKDRLRYGSLCMKRNDWEQNQTFKNSPKAAKWVVTSFNSGCWEHLKGCHKFEIVSLIIKSSKQQFQTTLGKWNQLMQYLYCYNIPSKNWQVLKNINTSGIRYEYHKRPHGNRSIKWTSSAFAAYSVIHVELMLYITTHSLSTSLSESQYAVTESVVVLCVASVHFAL